ncbi:hypothetical protein [Pseudonocardia sp. T1-2H]|uniref:hypothetical protein n=1 Tax=Pseudonocardia sp. T1-2H TaxID=3128899 RepID=UPI0031016CD3
MTPRGAAVASAACCAEIEPCCFSWSITTLRRESAASGCAVGSYWLGLCTIPASSADCGTSSCDASTPK